MTRLTTFRLFRKLPLELRLIIWRLCLPHRVRELNFFSDRSGLCNLSSTTQINRRSPVITRVCRESRAVAFETIFSEIPPPEASWSSGRANLSAWLDYERDSVHLNIEWYDPKHSDGSRSRFTYLAWMASRVRDGGSLIFEYLYKNAYRPLWDCAPIGVLKQLST